MEENLTSRSIESHEPSSPSNLAEDILQTDGRTKLPGVEAEKRERSMARLHLCGGAVAVYVGGGGSLCVAVLSRNDVHKVFFFLINEYG